MVQQAAHSIDKSLTTLAADSHIAEVPRMACILGRLSPGIERGNNKNPTREGGVPHVGWVGVPGGGGVGCARGGITQKKYNKK